MPQLKAAGIEVPNEVINDCDPGDKQYIVNATGLQSKYFLQSHSKTVHTDLT